MISILIAPAIVGLILFLWSFFGRDIASSLHEAAVEAGNAALGDFLHRLLHKSKLGRKQCEIEILGADLDKEANKCLCDLFSKPDPMVKIKHHGFHRMTGVERDTFQPRFMWKSRMPLFEKKGEGFSIDMVDHDRLGRDEVIGRAYLNAEKVSGMLKSNKPEKISLGEGIGSIYVKITEMDMKHMQKKGGQIWYSDDLEELDSSGKDNSASDAEKEQEEKKNNKSWIKSFFSDKTKKPSGREDEFVKDDKVSDVKEEQRKEEVTPTEETGRKGGKGGRLLTTPKKSQASRGKSHRVRRRPSLRCNRLSSEDVITSRPADSDRVRRSPSLRCSRPSSEDEYDITPRPDDWSFSSEHDETVQSSVASALKKDGFFLKKKNK